MEIRLQFEILAQPDDTTCGPTCLQAVYRYFGDRIGLSEVIRETGRLEGGGTLAVLLGCHALARGYQATLYTFDLQVLDPTWFSLSPEELSDKLKRQLLFKRSRRLEVVTESYLTFLSRGGSIRFADLTTDLLRGFLKRRIPILTGLSATYLYRSAREIDRNDRLIFDDIRGEPSGHFVVLSGYHLPSRTAIVADPLHPNPLSPRQYYEVKFNRLIPAIMLGTLTFDANLLVITPEKLNPKGSR